MTTDTTSIIFFYTNTTTTSNTNTTTTIITLVMIIPASLTPPLHPGSYMVPLHSLHGSGFHRKFHHACGLVLNSKSLRLHLTRG